MKLSVIIVNYNVKYFLEQCLISVARACIKLDAEVIVLDNASSDGSCEMLREKFPKVQLVQSNVNLGFAKANNVGIKLAIGEYVLLLNPDTVVAEDTFEKCIAFMSQHRDAGALGVHMIDGKGNFLPESKRGLPTPMVAFYKTFGFSALFPRSKIFGRYRLEFLPENETNEVDILSGAYMFMRKTALDKSGLLDEDFFMYGEDIDLSYRISKQGYKNYYYPETTIIHYKGESTRKGSLNYVKVFYNAMIIFAKKHFSQNRSGYFTVLIRLAILFRGFLTLIAGLFSSSYLLVVDALLSFAGIYFIKTYWEGMIKYTSHYYPNEFLFIVVPLYILVWVFFTFLNGGYDKPYRILNILKGVFLGTLAIAAIYAFLPEEWRFSRAIIILGAIWTGFEMLVTRTIYHLLKYQTFTIENEDEKRALIMGPEEECIRAERLLTEARAAYEIVSFIRPGENLSMLASVYNINEIIFCSKNIAYGQIITDIRLCGSGIDYKILNENSDAFIGSNSKNTAGDLYAFEQDLRLAKPLGKRTKRMFDVMLCIILIPLLPINLLVIKKPMQFIANWLNVFIGRKSWVGYAGESRSLPALKTGVITLNANFEYTQLEPEVLYKLNLLYAKHYRLSDDLKLICKNYRNLGS